MNTTLRNKLLVGTALVATGVFSYSDANAATVTFDSQTILNSPSSLDKTADPIIKLDAGANLTVDIDLDDNDNDATADNDTFLLNANDVQLTINSGKTIKITEGDGAVVKAEDIDGAKITINGSVQAIDNAKGAIDLSALTGTNFGTITINGGTGANDGKIKGEIIGGNGADILNLNATNGNVEIDGIITLGNGKGTINVTGVATKTITLKGEVTNVEQVNVGANAKLEVQADYTSTNTKLGAGSVFITGADSTVTSDIQGEAAGNGTLQIDADTILVGNVGSTTAINKIIVGDDIELFVDANSLNKNATIKTTNGIHLNGGTNDAYLSIDAKGQTVTIDSIVTTQTPGKGLIGITGDAGTTIFKASVGANGKALEGFVILDASGNSNAKVYGDLWVNQIAIGTDDVLEFLGTNQVVSGNIYGLLDGIGTITVGNGTAATNVTFNGAVGATKTLAAANVLKASSATFSNNVVVDNDFINNGTVTVAQGKTLTAGKFDAGDAVGTYNITIGTDAAGADNSATLASTAAIDFNLLNGKTAGGAKLNLTQGTGVIAKNQPFKIVDGKVSNVVGLSTTLVNVDHTFALFDFKVRTGDPTVLAGTDAQDVIAIATHDATAGGVITVSANQSTASAILGITAAQYNAADANFKTLYDTVTRASKANINNALEAVRPELHMAGVAAATSVTRQTTSLANTQLASLRDGSESGMYAGSASGGLRAWLQGFGQTADQSTRNGIAGYEADSYGVAVGFDTSDLAQNWVLGLMFAYGNSDIDSKSVNLTTTDIDSYQLGLYSSYNFDSATYLTGQLGYIWMSNDQLRRNVIPGVNAKGDFDSYSVYARLEAGRGYNVGGDAIVTPKFLVNYQHYNADSYTETLSGGGGLNVSADSINIFELGVGADVKWNLQQADGAVFQPKFSAGVRHDLIGDEFKTTNSFIAVPSASFTTRGADPAQTTYNLGAALTYFSAANWELSAAYDYEAKADFNSHTGSLKASFKF